MPYFSSVRGFMSYIDIIYFVIYNKLYSSFGKDRYLMNILYEDNNIIAVLKSPGTPSQADKSGCESIVSMAEEHTGAPCHIINRLDRPVGGICILAKDKKTAAALTELMLCGETEKYYKAVVCGDIEQKGTLTDYIFFNKRENMSKIVNKGSMGAKPAVLDFEKIQSKNGLSLIKVRLHTGRHHQIRVQLAHHGCPIWGDTKYNNAFRFKRTEGIALFACEYSFTHPVSGEKIKITAKEDFSLAGF